MQKITILYTDPKTLDTRILKTSFNENVLKRDLDMFQRAFGKKNVKIA